MTDIKPADRKHLVVCNLMLVFLLIALTTIGQSVGQPVTLLTWNIQNMGKSKEAAEIAFIAATVKHADIIAIQEVVAGYGGAQSVARLAEELNTTGSAWDYVVSDPTISTGGKTERYAFLWKKGKIKLRGKAWSADGKYAALIEREPYMATFETGGELITVVSFHAKTKKEQPETEIKYFKEFPALYPEHNLVFLGDFNLSESHSVFNPLKSMGYAPALQGQKTSLRQKCMPDGCLASEYDNIFYRPDKLAVAEKGILHFYRNLPAFEQARAISDHVPVFIKFTFKRALVR